MHLKETRVLALGILLFFTDRLPWLCNLTTDILLYCFSAFIWPPQAAPGFYKQSISLCTMLKTTTWTVGIIITNGGPPWSSVPLLC
jgi:hypothetical protein